MDGALILFPAHALLIVEERLREQEAEGHPDAGWYHLARAGAARSHRGGTRKGELYGERKALNARFGQWNERVTVATP
jgi:hypothetical protein